MKRAARLAVPLLAVLLLAACSQGPGGHRGMNGLPFKPIADPGKVVATEMGFARTAQDKGQWSAFSEFADDDAVMFVPQPVKARDWLRGRDNPAVALRWQPHQVWSSCDGSLAVTKGAWQQPDGSFGYFTTVWKRQKDGGYRWVLDQGDELDEPLAEPEMVQARVADCPNRDDAAKLAAIVAGMAAPATGRIDTHSKDNTLFWRTEISADNGRTSTLRAWQGGELRTVLASEVAAAPSG
jgi:hypothetical protein